MLHPNNYFRLPGTTIFDAMTAELDTISYDELTHAALCTISLNFREAFDKIFHTYLLRMIKIMVLAWSSSHSYKRLGTRLFLCPNYWLLYRTLSHAMFHYTRLFNELDTIRFFFLNPLIFLCLGDRLVEQIYDHPGQPILSGNNRNWFQIDEYSSPFKEYHLILDESKVKSLERDPYGRELCPKHCTRYVTLYYSQRYGTQNRFSQPRWSKSDKS